MPTYRTDDQRVKCMISLAWSDSETMYDDDYEVCGLVDVLESGYGFARQFRVYDIRISAPGGSVKGSRAVPEFLPSDWHSVAEDALVDQASEDCCHSGPQYDDGPLYGDE